MIYGNPSLGSDFFFFNKALVKKNNFTLCFLVVSIKFKNVSKKL